MPVNFYNFWGYQVAGVDLHGYFAAVPPPVPPPEVPGWPHGVQFTFWWPTTTEHKEARTVESDGKTMLQGGHDWYLTPHLPFPLAPPAVAEEIVQLAQVIASSGSKAQMSVHSVEGKGQPLATCVFYFLAVNVNCSEPFDMMSNYGFQWGTVYTEPTWGDYVGALVGYVVDCAMNYGAGKAFKKWANDKWLPEAIMKHLLRRAPDVAPPADIPGYVTKFVQRAIDDSPQKALEKTAEDIKNDLKKTVDPSEVLKRAKANPLPR
jgi:hypothetical protein